MDPARHVVGAGIGVGHSCPVDEPFDLAPARELGNTSAWSRQVTQVLSSPRKHRVGLFSSPVGLVGVHDAEGRDGLRVASVIGPPNVSAADMLAAAHGVVARLVADLTHDRGSFSARDLFELPIGEGDSWTLVEVDGMAGWQRSSAALPAWVDHPPSIWPTRRWASESAFAGLADDLVGQQQWSQAGQVARAEYGRLGFEPPPSPRRCSGPVGRGRGPERHLTVRFGRPYAAVAYATHIRGPRIESLSPWHGLPVFSRAGSLTDRRLPGHLTAAAQQAEPAIRTRRGGGVSFGAAPFTKRMQTG